MSAFFGVNHERVAAGTPYKVHSGAISTPKHPFSEQWRTERKTFIEVISASTQLRLTHNGMQVAAIAEYEEQTFLDSIPQDVSSWLTHYRIISDSSLSLEVNVILKREFWLLSDDTPNARLIQAGATDADPKRPIQVVYWVDPQYPEQAQNWASAMRKTLSPSDLRPHDNPGFCISSPSELLSIVVWRSIDQQPYDQALCQANARNALEQHSLWAWHTGTTTDVFTQQILAEDGKRSICEAPPSISVASSSRLMDINEATESQCFILAEVVRRDLGPTISLPSLRLIFKGCLLPYTSFTKELLAKTPDDLLDDIRLWMYLRFVGLPKKSASTLTQKDARALAEAISKDNWRDALYDPLSLGYLPY